MKKIVLTGVLAASLLVSTGCEKTKTLDCSYTQDTSIYSMKQDMKATFKGKKLSTIDQTVKMTIADKYVAYMDKMVESAKAQYSDYEDKKGVTIDVKQEGSDIIVSMNMEPSKMDSKTLKKISGTDDYSTETYENAKSSLEKRGFTCK